MLKIVEFSILDSTLIEYWYQLLNGETITVARTPHGVCFIGFGKCDNELRDRFAKATLHKIENKVDIYSINSLHLVGSPFSLLVWRELLNIAHGHTTSYAQVAKNIGQPRAMRAVGSAVGRNPVSIIVPCHRVLRSDGSLGGYYWGEARKINLLKKEGIST